MSCYAPLCERVLDPMIPFLVTDLCKRTAAFGAFLESILVAVGGPLLVRREDVTAATHVRPLQ
eukprot:798044-Amphidinium_carterae.1